MPLDAGSFEKALFFQKEVLGDVILNKSQVGWGFFGLNILKSTAPYRISLNFILVAGCALALAGCNVEAQKSSLESAAVQSKEQKIKENQSAKSQTVMKDGVGETSVTKVVGYDKTGKPYTISGKLYVPQEQKGYSATGLASWYGVGFHGRETANGEVFNRDSVTVAHPTLPLPSYVRVTNVLNGRSIIALSLIHI